MATTDDLIKRARELAALADIATPGPWSSEVEATRRLVHKADVGYCDAPECWCLEDGLIATVEREGDAPLIAAAPEMAMLLRQMAAALEHADEKARGSLPDKVIAWLEENARLRRERDDARDIARRLLRLARMLHRMAGIKAGHLPDQADRLHELAEALREALTTDPALMRLVRGDR